MQYSFPISYKLFEIMKQNRANAAEFLHYLWKKQCYNSTIRTTVFIKVCVREDALSRWRVKARISLLNFGNLSESHILECKEFELLVSWFLCSTLRTIFELHILQNLEWYGQMKVTEEYVTILKRRLWPISKLNPVIPLKRLKDLNKTLLLSGPVLLLFLF